MPPDTAKRRSALARGRRGSAAGLIVLAAVALVARGVLAADAPAPAAPPPLESGDTAPPPGAPPLPPVSPPVLPPDELAPVTPLPPPPAMAPLVVPLPPAPRRQPVYDKDWFWGAVGVVVVTGAVILALALGSGDPSTPNTKLGDMRAF